MLRIYNWADLHIDYNNYKSIFKIISKVTIDKSHTNCLLVPGDLCNPFYEETLNYFDFVSKTFDHTFYIAGNHEFYNYSNMTMDKIKDKIRENLKKYDNITFLDNEIVKKYGYTFIGTTLWSNIPDINKRYVKNNIADYYRIYVNNGAYISNITINDTNSFNEECVNFLNKFIDYDSKEKYIVITHHSPLFGSKSFPTCQSKHYNSENMTAFHNNLKNMIKSPIVLWCYGHTHYNSNFKYNNVTLWTSQYGYNFENTSFDVNGYCELKIFN